MYIVLAATIILVAFIPGIPLIEEPLYGQQRASATFRFSFAPILQSPSQPEVRLAKGKFLVASRQLRDPNFLETVVLLIEYNRSGAMGLVINRPTEVKLSTLLPDMEGLQDLQNTVYVGGPVAKNQMLLLIRSGSQPEDTNRVFKDIYVSSSRAVLRKMVSDKDPGKTFRLYAGHAGWSPGQLDREIARGGWHVLQADAASVFEIAPSEIWPELIHRSSALWVMLMEP
jgi:putative transcriptional regulator